MSETQRLVCPDCGERHKVPADQTLADVHECTADKSAKAEKTTTTEKAPARRRTRKGSDDE